MNRILEHVYFKSPIVMQNVLVSAYGYVLRNRRYGGRSSEYLQQLRNSQYFSRGKMLRLQMEELRKILQHAFAHVPYYRKLSATLGLSSEDFTDFSDLQRLPIVDKEQIRTDPASFRAEESSLSGKIFELNTSGTSGKPLTVYCSTDSRRKHYAFWQRLREWFGIYPEMRRATFFGRITVPPEQSGPPFWRYDAFQKNYLFSSYHMSETNLRYYHEGLLHIRPEELIGYPSSLFVLAKYMKRNGLGGIKPMAIFTTAETLLDHQRTLIEDVFDRKVVDQYGCTEMAMFVSQCEKGSYHIHPEHGIIEVVDSQGRPLPDGEEGEAVCTGFVNSAMPMIRYRVGDRLVIGEEKCPCRRCFPIVKQIAGRIDDILIAPDGRPLGRLDPVFKGMSGIYETQIIQTSPDQLVFKMVPDPAFSDENEEELLYEIRKRTGDKMRITIEFVDEIPKDANGKFRSVISAIEDEKKLTCQTLD